MPRVQDGTKIVFTPCQGNAQSPSKATSVVLPLQEAPAN